MLLMTSLWHLTVFRYISRYVLYRDLCIEIRIVSWGTHIITPQPGIHLAAPLGSPSLDSTVSIQNQLHVWINTAGQHTLCPVTGQHLTTSMSRFKVRTSQIKSWTWFKNCHKNKYHCHNDIYEWVALICQVTFNKNSLGALFQISRWLAYYLYLDYCPILDSDLYHVDHVAYRRDFCLVPVIKIHEIWVRSWRCSSLVAWFCIRW